MMLGIPMQIRENYKRKSTEGLKLFMIITLLFTTISWVVYSWVTKNWFIFIANVPGAVCALIILIQFKIYRKRGRP